MDEEKKLEKLIENVEAAETIPYDGPGSIPNIDAHAKHARERYEASKPGLAAQMESRLNSITGTSGKAWGGWTPEDKQLPAAPEAIPNSELVTLTEDGKDFWQARQELSGVIQNTRARAMAAGENVDPADKDMLEAMIAFQMITASIRRALSHKIAHDKACQNEEPFEEWIVARYRGAGWDVSTGREVVQRMEEKNDLQSERMRALDGIEQKLWASEKNLGRAQEELRNVKTDLNLANIRIRELSQALGVYGGIQEDGGRVDALIGSGAIPADGQGNAVADGEMGAVHSGQIDTRPGSITEISSGTLEEYKYAPGDDTTNYNEI